MFWTPGRGEKTLEPFECKNFEIEEHAPYRQPPIRVPKPTIPVPLRKATGPSQSGSDPRTALASKKLL
jgi:hypothetical protein